MLVVHVNERKWWRLLYIYWFIGVEDNQILNCQNPGHFCQYTFKWVHIFLPNVPSGILIIKLSLFVGRISTALWLLSFMTWLSLLGLETTAISTTLNLTKLAPTSGTFIWKNVLKSVQYWLFFLYTGEYLVYNHNIYTRGSFPYKQLTSFRFEVGGIFSG